MSHYSTGGIEAIDYIKAKLSKEEFMGFCRGNVIKYVTRAGKKRGAKHCYQKAEYYLNLLADYERDQNLIELMEKTKKPVCSVTQRPTHHFLCLFCEKPLEESCDCECTFMCGCGQLKN